MRASTLLAARNGANCVLIVRTIAPYTCKPLICRLSHNSSSSLPALTKTTMEQHSSTSGFSSTVYPVLDTTNVILEDFEQKTSEEILNFMNHAEAFRWKTTWEIFRGLCILRLSALDFLVNNSLRFMHFFQRYFGNWALRAVFKPTFYKQFVGGETPEELAKTIKRLQEIGIRPIFSLTMEEDIGEGGNDETYDRNCLKVLDCIDMSTSLGSEVPMVALKITGLLSADLAAYISDIYNESQCKETLVNAVIEGFKGNGVKMESFMSKLSNDQQKSFELGITRLSKICQVAVTKNVKLLVDAEFTYMNPCLSLLTLAMMGAFNHSSPLIYNTYQCYLKKTLENMMYELSIAENLGVCFGAKIVRGAYMEQERKRAQELGYESPICDDYEATNENYKRVLNSMLEQVHRAGSRYSIVVATHNADSVQFATQRMKELNISKQGGNIFFGQLYGMCDQITSPLASTGYAAYKCIPYGTVEEVLPYLSRRANENRSVLKGSRNEQELLGKELKSRISGSLRCQSHNSTRASTG